MKKTNYFGVYKEGNKYYTKALVKESVYGERLNGEYREWMPKRSKLGAGIYKNLRIFPFKNDSRVLYLGASSGTTCSHISDIVVDGMIFSVELSPRVFYKFMALVEKRKNLYPILADANHPERYGFVPKVDIVFQDIAQKDQVNIFMKNCDAFLKKGGFGFLAVKSRSIDAVKSPKFVFKEVRKELQKRYKIVDERNLNPFERDHMLFVVKSR